MTEPIKTTYAVPPGQPMSLTLFYVTEVTVQASSNDVSIILHDILPVAGHDGIDPNAQVRRPLAMVKVSPQTLKGIALALNVAVQAYEEDYGKLSVGPADRVYE